MKYTEQQLQSWTSPLSRPEEQRAENTIKMIKAAVDANDELKTLDYEVFVQGSFANNTNVRADSDACFFPAWCYYCSIIKYRSSEDSTPYPKKGGTLPPSI